MTIDKNFLSNTLNCNCNKKEECPLPCVCLTSAIVYQAEVKTSEETTTYIGITGGTFKQIIIIIINFIPSQVCFFILIHCVLIYIKMERSRLKHNAYINPAPLFGFTTHNKK